MSIDNITCFIVVYGVCGLMLFLLYGLFVYEILPSFRKTDLEKEMMTSTRTMCMKNEGKRYAKVMVDSFVKDFERMSFLEIERINKDHKDYIEHLKERYKYLENKYKQLENNGQMNMALTDEVLERVYEKFLENRKEAGGLQELSTSFEKLMDKSRKDKG